MVRGRTVLLACVVLAMPTVSRAQVSELPSSAVLLQVQVTDITNRPLPGVEIRLDANSLGETDELGQFYLPRKPFPPGRYKLTASLLGYGTKATLITIPADQATLPVKARFELREEEAEAHPQVGNARANFKVYQIFYATDRQVANRNEPEEYYGGEASSSGALEVGTCEVSIPFSHIPGAMEAPSYIKLEFKFDPEKHIQLYTPHPLASDKFYQKLAARVAASKSKEAFVFIHGYNTRFGVAARRTAQLTADLGFEGAAVLYSWPSKGTFEGYFSDQKLVEWTVPHLRAFLEEIAARSGATRVHLIAHSMGNRAMTHALQAMADGDANGSKPHFQQIVLAAPDIRVNTLGPLAKAMVPMAKKITLYASANDDALILARILDGVARAGERVRDVVLPGIDAVDASAVRTDFIGHGYFAASPSLIADLRALLTGTPPERRRLVAVNLAALRYWMIPNVAASLK